MPANRRYGSKAAYEAAKSEERAERAEWERLMNMTDAERIKERNKDRLEDDAMGTHMLFMGASMSAGIGPVQADKNAAAARELLKARFT